MNSVIVLDNPSPFFNPFQFEITFECIEDLPEGKLSFLLAVPARCVSSSKRLNSHNFKFPSDHTAIATNHSQQANVNVIHLLQRDRWLADYPFNVKWFLFFTLLV